MGQVLPFPLPEDVADAWHTYAAMKRAQAHEPCLLFDPEFNELIDKKHEQWRRLFLREQQ